MQVIKKSSGRRRGTSYDKGCFMELPVAPRINARIRFSATLQGPTRHLRPEDAVEKIKMIMNKGTTIDCIGITCPGDPLAFIEPTLETFEQLHVSLPAIPFFVKTLGIGGEKYADKLSKVGVAHVDLQVNAVTEDIVEKLYAWVRPGFRTLRLPDSAKILISEQKKAVMAFKDAKMSVSVITTVYPENNSHHIECIAHQMAEYGADDMIIIPYQPEADAEIQLGVPDGTLMAEAHINAARYITVSDEQSPSVSIENGTGTELPKPTPKRPNTAVVSSNGMDIDLHLGAASRILIYGPREDGLACLLESRTAPEPGGGDARWKILAETLSDCFVLLTSSAGDNPQKILNKHGIRVLVIEDTIDGTVDVLYGGGRKKAKGRK